jgi:signal transduction histidine kinase
LVEKTLRFLLLSLPNSVIFHLELQCPTERILANATQMEQVVMNLCLNAVQALPEQKGTVTVRLQRVEAEAIAREKNASSLQAPCLLLTVSDTGCGIAPEMLTRVFDPFFSTKPVGQGSGLGLAVVHSIVTAHNGGVTIESQLGQGATFRVYLPILHVLSASEGAQAASLSTTPRTEEES